MSRNIVLCCDGTANEFARDHTNVLKLYSVLEQDPGRQVTYYHPGLGTMEAPGAVTPAARKVTKILGLAIGYGLERDIFDAYAFLMNHYRDGDKLFLFGFSRGAYTVRALASFLRMYGLLRQGNEAQVPYAIRMMMAIRKAEMSGKGNVSSYFDTARRFKSIMSRGSVAPWFVGVWDTVSSVGWIENPVRVPYSSNNPDIAIGRHAIAIDERRAFFRTNLWRPPSNAAYEVGPRDLKQVWFPGVHCDVGGGFPEAESGLSKLSLAWMLSEASGFGLQVRRDEVDRVLGRTSTQFSPPDPDAILHESLKGVLWHLAEFIPKRHYDWSQKRETRRMNRHRRRTIPDGALIHSSVLARRNYSPVLPDVHTIVQ